MWYYILLTMAVYLLMTLVNSFRYRIILSHAGGKITTFSAFLIHEFVKFSTILVPFKLGAVVTKPLATKAFTGIEVRKSFPVIFFEQMLDAYWQVLTLPILLIAIGESGLVANMGVDIVILCSLALFVLLSYMKRDWIFSKMFRVIKFLPGKMKAMGKNHGLDESSSKKLFEESIGYFSDWRLLVKIAPPTIFFILLSPVTIYLLGPAFSSPVGYWEAFVAFWASFIIGRVSGLPDGIGSKDLGLGGLLVYFGMDPVAALQVLVLHRLLGMVPPLLIGGAVSVHLGGKRFNRKKEKA